MEISAKFKDIIEKVEAMSVLELSDLVKVLKKNLEFWRQLRRLWSESDFATGRTSEIEKSSFNVELKEAGVQKIQVIKVLREALGLGPQGSQRYDRQGADNGQRGRGQKPPMNSKPNLKPPEAL